MTVAGSGAGGRAVFAVAALLLGVGTLVIGGWLAAWALLFGLAGPMVGDAGRLYLALWGAAGLAGLAAALTLSVAFVHGGSPSLQRRSWLWWPVLIAGMVAAAPWLSALGRPFGPDWLALLAGPLLLPVALVLGLLRLSAPGPGPGPGPVPVPLSPVPGPRSPVPP